MASTGTAIPVISGIYPKKKRKTNEAQKSIMSQEMNLFDWRSQIELRDMSVHKDLYNPTAKVAYTNSEEELTYVCTQSWKKKKKKRKKRKKKHLISVVWWWMMISNFLVCVLFLGKGCLERRIG